MRIELEETVAVHSGLTKARRTMAQSIGSLWGSGDAYEKYMGRWSRRVAIHFLDWLSVPSGADWTDIGCGTGALSSTILARCNPSSVVGIEPFEAFVEIARSQVSSSRFQCRQGNGEALPLKDARFSAAVSGLVLNFVADKRKTVAEMRRVVRRGGSVALYVWDYAGHMQVMRHFFDTARELDPGAREFDDGVNAPICRPGPLSALFKEAGLADIEVQSLDIPAAFENFDDYWAPFIGGTGSAPRYCASLAPDLQARLREKLRSRLPTGPDGEILLAVRAWAIKSRVPK
jgi:SAM-dependent methyltransferase